MSDVPDGLLYSADHVWARIDGARARIGITHYAQEALGEVVFVNLLVVGTTCTVGASLGHVESLKSTSEIYSPVEGTIIACNGGVGGHPELVNSDPYGEGWLCEIEMAEAPEASLLSAVDYRAKVAED